MSGLLWYDRYKVWKIQDSRQIKIDKKYTN